MKQVNAPCVLGSQYFTKQKNNFREIKKSKLKGNVKKQQQKKTILLFISELNLYENFYSNSFAMDFHW